MANHYHRMPVKDWDRFQRVMIKMEADTAGEVDYIKLNRWRRRMAGKERLSMFKSYIKGATVSISEWPCPCCGNHYGLYLRKGQVVHMVCPVRFWMNMCALKNKEEGPTTMVEWAVKHPLCGMLVRVDPERDATHED